MARMKFLCDAERCIECNACVTACKNEHEVPWGINRRRVVTINDGAARRALDLGRLHALLGRAVHRGLPGRLHLSDRRRAWCCTPRTCASAAATASTPARSARRSSPRPATSARAARWTSAPSAPAARRRTAATPSSRSTAATAWPRASCPLCAEMCATKALLGRRRRRHLGHLPRARGRARLRLRRLGLGHRLSAQRRRVGQRNQAAGRSRPRALPDGTIAPPRGAAPAAPVRWSAGGAIPSVMIDEVIRLHEKLLLVCPRPPSTATGSTPSEKEREPRTTSCSRLVTTMPSWRSRPVGWPTSTERAHRRRPPLQGPRRLPQGLRPPASRSENRVSN